jgi:[acyl-carrier-protein] S-malonyltransferase
VRTQRPVALLLPGQGAQHQGMAVELFGPVPEFTMVLDEFFKLMGPEGQQLRDDWLSDHPGTPIDDASRAQPLLFGIGYALGRKLRSHGMVPTVLLGHSVGELAAAALAGVFDLAGAARLMLARSAAMAEVPPGGMLAVAASPEELAAYLDGSVVVGARNAPRQTVLAGPEPQLSMTQKALNRAGLLCRRVPARQPFHCPAVVDAARHFEAAFTEEDLRPPTVPIWSTRTARLVRSEEAVDPRFWAGQLAEPVLFWPALQGLLTSDEFTLVEAGPSQALSVLARRHPAVRRHRSVVVPLLPSRADGTLATWQAAVDRLISPA